MNNSNSIGRLNLLAGFDNILRNEFNIRFGAKRWILQVLLWVALLNIPLTISLQLGDMQNPAVEGTETFLIYLHFFTVIGAVIAVQGTFVSEIKTGTTAWTLTKPVSRSAYILAKAAMVYLSALATMIVPPAMIAYLEISIMTGHPLDVFPFLSAVFLAALHLLFYFSLAVLVCVMSSRPGPVIGSSIVLLLGLELLDDYILSFIPGLENALPSTLPRLAYAIGKGEATFVESALPASMGMFFWALLFIGLAIWHFNQRDL